MRGLVGRFWTTAVGRWLSAAFDLWVRTVIWLVEIEPTWFPEFGLAVSCFGWGLGAFITDDYRVEGCGYILPAVALMFGVIRAAALLRLWYGLRVALASMSFLLWAWLYITILGRYGVLPLAQVLWGAMLMEALTALKFAVPCARALWPHWSIWRDARA